MKNEASPNQRRTPVDLTTPGEMRAQVSDQLRDGGHRGSVFRI
jgi:hypothetical protein